MRSNLEVCYPVSERTCPTFKEMLSTSAPGHMIECMSPEQLVTLSLSSWFAGTTPLKLYVLLDRDILLPVVIERYVGRRLHVLVQRLLILRFPTWGRERKEKMSV